MSPGKLEGQPEEKEGSKNRPDHDLATTMNEIVSDLERENTRLRAELDLARSELVRSQKEAAAVALIPQYREAVTRARTTAEVLRRQLDAELAARQDLESRLLDAESKWRETAQQSAELAERNASMDASIARKEMQSSSIARKDAASSEKYRAAYEELSSTAVKQQRVIAELQQVVDEQRYHMMQHKVADSTQGASTNFPSGDEGGIESIFATAAVAAAAATATDLNPVATEDIRIKGGPTLSQNLGIVYDDDDDLGTDDLTLSSSSSDDNGGSATHLSTSSSSSSCSRYESANK